MRFYQGSKPAIIWNPEAKKPRVQFVNGIFETEDAELINLLEGKGYLTQMQKDTLIDLGTKEHGGFRQATSTRMPPAKKGEDKFPIDTDKPQPAPDKPKRQIKRRSS